MMQPQHTVFRSAGSFNSKARAWLFNIRHIQQLDLDAGQQACTACCIGWISTSSITSPLTCKQTELLSWLMHT
jgi:hypothetical protein